MTQMLYGRLLGKALRSRVKRAGGERFGGGISVPDNLLDQQSDERLLRPRQSHGLYLLDTALNILGWYDILLITTLRGHIFTGDIRLLLNFTARNNLDLLIRRR